MNHHRGTGARRHCPPNTEDSQRKIFRFFFASSRLCAFALSLFAFLVAAPVFADEVAPEPVIDPAGIFAEGVTVVETIEPPLIADSEQRVLYWHNPDDTWSAYDYPADLGWIILYEPRSDGTYLLLDQGDHGGVPENLQIKPVEYLWLFDPQTGEFSRPKAACGVAKALPGEGKWWLLSDNYSLDVCNTATGQRKDVPDAIFDTFKHECDWVARSAPVEMSPDGRYLVLFPCYGGSFTAEPLRFYRFDLQDGSATWLGELTDFEAIRIERWIGDTLVIATTDNLGSMFPVNRLYKVDVSEYDRLEVFAQFGKTTPVFFEHPARYVWFAGSAVHEYRLATGEGHRLLIFPPADEIEKPNELYFSPMSGSDTGYLARIWSVSFPGAVLEIYDLTNGRQAYAANILLGSTFAWANENTFVFAERETGALYRVVLDGEKCPCQTRYPDVFDSVNEWWGWSPDARYVLLERKGVNSQPEAIEIYSVEQQTHQPLIQPDVFERLTATEHRFFVAWLPDNSLHVLLRDKDGQSQGEWRVRIDAIAEENE